MYVCQYGGPPKAFASINTARRVRVFKAMKSSYAALKSACIDKARGFDIQSGPLTMGPPGGCDLKHCGVCLGSSTASTRARDRMASAWCMGSQQREGQQSLGVAWRRGCVLAGSLQVPPGCRTSWASQGQQSGNATRPTQHLIADFHCL
jgi:hypothetical protein